MSVDLITPGFCSLDLQSRRTNSSIDSHRFSMFNRLKSQFGSHKEQHHSSSHQNRNIEQQTPQKPQSYTASATRRPAPGTMKPFAVPGDAPPAYSAAPSIVSAAQPSTLAQSSPQAQGADDPYSFLSTFDTVFLIDDSGSMAGSRWRETADALETITPICTAHDADGIDIFFLNHPNSIDHQNVTSPAAVRRIFQKVQPCGGTPTGQRLNQIIKPYIQRYAAKPDNTKPLNIICITDGEPHDDVESPLINAAKKLDKLDAPAWQLGVQFFQVGNDEAAKRHLKQLDDDLADIAGDDELRDIVDTVPFTGEQGTHLTGEGVMKVVLGSVLKRLDRKKSKDLHR